MNSSDNRNSWVPMKIERLRNKLLNLSYRNPLLSTKLDSSRNSYIRVVDELPDILFSRLHSQGEFTFKPLPPLPLEENPRDEEKEEFQDRLAEAHINDPDYIRDIEEIDPSDEDAFVKEQNAERELRDRIRTELGMPPRRTQDQSLAEHARKHGISPYYDLPSESEKEEHVDDLIQTLLLPDKLERAARRLIGKNREWQEKTGINVMHVAFGFLEWTDPASNKNTFSPLVLLPALLQAFFSVPALSLRTVAQAIHRLGLVFASLHSNQRSFVPMTVVLLIIRTINSDLYCKFIRGEITDSEVVKRVFDSPGVKDLQWKNEGYFFEAMVILGALEQSSESSSNVTESPLYKKYNDLAETESYDPTKNLDHRHANGVLEMVGRFHRPRSYGDALGFKQSVQRLELLTSFLIDEHTEATSQDS